jgi:hypothetical protein
MPNSKFDDRELRQALGLVRVELATDREHRIRLIGRFAEDTLSGRVPPAEAQLFVAGALKAWLESGDGDLAKDHFRVTKPKSHDTPSRIWRRMRGLITDERQVTPRQHKMHASKEKRSR